MGQITPADVTKKYLELRAYKEAMQERHDAEMKPISNAMTTLENWALAYLNANGGQNFACDDGTFFKKGGTSIKVENRDTFFDFVAQENAWDMLASSVSKDAVKVYIEAHEGNPPPGVKIDNFTQVQFRRA